MPAGWQKFSSVQRLTPSARVSLFEALDGFACGLGDFIVGGFECEQVVRQGIELKRVFVGQGRKYKRDELIVSQVAANDVVGLFAHVARVVLGADKDASIKKQIDVVVTSPELPILKRLVKNPLDDVFVLLLNGFVASPVIARVFVHLIGVLGMDQSCCLKSHQDHSGQTKHCFEREWPHDGFHGVLSEPAGARSTRLGKNESWEGLRSR